MLDIIENLLHKKAQINQLPMQIGDVNSTSADITKATRLLNYIPSTNFADGLQKFIDWKKAQ